MSATQTLKDFDQFASCASLSNERSYLVQDAIDEVSEELAIELMDQIAVSFESAEDYALSYQPKVIGETLDCERFGPAFLRAIILAARKNGHQGLHDLIFQVWADVRKQIEGVAERKAVSYIERGFHE
jgi:hypothetical protein